ncbi:hypothetical protein G6F62_014945 [Rhizopus arrhizus]|nr:hypothetical protein G6F62_014945 [Rhizopus arrhizus]
MVKRGLQVGCPEPSMVATVRALATNGLIQTRLDNLIELKSQCIKIGTYSHRQTIYLGSKVSEDDWTSQEEEGAQDKKETEDYDQTREQDRHGLLIVRCGGPAC